MTTVIYMYAQYTYAFCDEISGTAESIFASSALHMPRISASITNTEFEMYHLCDHENPTEWDSLPQIGKWGTESYRPLSPIYTHLRLESKVQ